MNDKNNTITININNNQKWSLKAIRVKRKMSADEVSKKVGVSTQTLLNYEKNINKAKLGNIIKILKFYDLKFEDLDI